MGSDELYKQMTLDALSHGLSVSSATIKRHVENSKISTLELITFPTLRRLVAITIAGEGLDVVHKLFQLVEEYYPTPTGDSPEEVASLQKLKKAFAVYDFEFADMSGELK